MEKEKKFWFRRKIYGWGWYPASWQGWVTILAWAILFVWTITTLDHEWLKNIIVSFVLTGILIFICYKKGEKPRWQWGCPKEEDKNNSTLVK